MASWKQLDEKERKRLEHDLEDIGENLPDEVFGVEGSDVDDVERHGHPLYEEELSRPKTEAEDEGAD